jgi:Sec-independent protein secretion pathway component TatC
MLALPMWGLYEVGIIVARIMVKSRAKADAVRPGPAD